MFTPDLFPQAARGIIELLNFLVQVIAHWGLNRFPSLVNTLPHCNQL